MKLVSILFLLSSLSLLAELRVLSYNIRHGAGMDNKLDLDRTANVLIKQDADLVALQEVDQVCTRSNKVDQADFLAKKLGKFNHRFGSFMDYQGGKYGLAILSRYPILESRVHKMPGGAEPRVALEIEVEVPQTDGSKQRISFVCVHFDYVRDDTARFAQAQHLIKVLAQRKHPVIVTGDFNDKRGSKTLDAFVEAFTIPSSSGPTFSSAEPRVEIDFCVHRGFPEKPKTQVIKGIQASDHLPLLTVFPKFGIAR